MQEKISALMDGELNAEEAAVLIAQFKNTEELREHWVAYHLISDAFGQSELKPLDVTRRINARLASEPAVLVTPTVRPVTKRRPVAYAAAASIAAVVVGGWMSLQTAQAPQPLQQNLAGSQSTPVAPVAAYPAVPTDASISASAPAQINDYLLAHREFSPSTAIHGVVPYMRAAVESHENIGR